MARRLPPPRLIGSGLIPETYQGQYNAAEEDYQGQLAELQRGERSLFRDYGFQGGIGAGGEVNFGVDPTNQFGAYQSLLRQIGGQLGQAKQEVRGRGLGRAGLAKARENLIRFMMSGEKANLATGFNKAAGEIFAKRGSALTGRNRRFAELEGTALDWWNQYGPDDPDGTIPEPSPPAANPFAGVDPTASFQPGVTTPQQGYGMSMALAQQLQAQNPASQFDVGQPYAPAIQPTDPGFGVNLGMTADPAFPVYPNEELPRRRTGPGGLRRAMM